MTTSQLLIHGWSWNPLVLAACAAALAGYWIAFRSHGRVGYFVAAFVMVLLALDSPINTLADGYLFSAHMVQHILLLLVVPALLVLSLPASFALGPRLHRLAHPLIGWLAGVGAMWLWHAPALCNAATASRPVFALQSVSLLIFGTLFWWQVLARRADQRLEPLHAILYLFTACVACSVLGIIITFSPVQVCSIYMRPADRLGLLPTIHQTWGMTCARDQQIGGLLMWVPMCAIYASAILSQFARWHSTPVPTFTRETL